MGPPAHTLWEAGPPRIGEGPGASACDRPGRRRRCLTGEIMAWSLAFILAGLCAFLFDGEIAQHIPFTDQTVRLVMMGSLIGLAAGFGIHCFERAPR